MAKYEQLMDEEANGLQWTLGISVSIRPDVVGKQVYGHYNEEVRLNMESEDEITEPEDAAGQEHFQSRVLNTLVRCIIRKVPRQCLRYFQWVCS